MNVAARITEHASIGGVCMSGETWLHVRHNCQGASLGQTEIKGKGAMELIEARTIG